MDTYIHDRLQAEGFAFVEGATMREWLDPAQLADWDRFAASWDRLEPDTYLAKLGRHRRRRHAVFRAGPGGIVRLPHQPHFQSLSYNPLQGDIQRWFEPVEPAVSDGPTLRRILGFAHELFGGLAPEVRQWRVEVHQFRIEARPDLPGEPTPEGVHHDGVDYVLVLLVDRRNIERGITTIHDADGSEVGHFTLARPLDAALVDDARVAHGVTPVEAADPSLPGHRDVLVATFRRGD